MFKNLIILLFMSIVLASCQKSGSGEEAIFVKPTISTVAPSGITSTTAVSGGTIINNGPVNVIAAGVCWAEVSNPNIRVNQHTTDTTKLGTFSNNITGLKPNTSYFIRAYIVVQTDTLYGKQVMITTSGKHIYIAGYERQYSNDTYIARYWKDGVATELSDGTKDVVALSICADGNDVYVAGYERDGNYRVAKLWKNGVASNISNAPYGSAAYAVLVNNGNVYVAGSESYGFYRVATLWVNGVAQHICSGVHDSEIYGIAIELGKVYLTGFEDDRGTGFVQAKYWVDGIPTVLNSGINESIGKAVAVSGNNVYVVGDKYLTNSPDHFLMLWKDGVPVNIDQGDLANSYVSDVAISGNDVHVCGNTRAAGAVWWKNGTATSLTGPVESFARGIQIVDGTVYIAGAVVDNLHVPTPAYWVDGVKVSLPHTQAESIAMSIFVQ